jgi:hypothetical protein
MVECEKEMFSEKDFVENNKSSDGWDRDYD